MSRRSGPKQDANGNWYFVVDLGTVDGKRKQARRRFGNGKGAGRKARAAYAKLLDSVTEKTYVAPARQTLAEFVRVDWLPTQERELERSTYESYARNMRLHVIPTLGATQMQRLDAAQLNRLYTDLLANGRKALPAGGLKPRTVRYVHTIVHACLDDARRWGRVPVNVADRANPPSAESARPPEMQVWDAATLARFLDATEGDRYHVSWLFLATTGVRRGECLGLRWSDVDLDTGRASIRRQVVNLKDGIVETDRTKRGRGRLIELDARTVTALRAWRARQGQERLALGAGYDDRGLVFCLPDGRPFHPERFSREFTRRVARHGVPRIRLHDLRHTWATLALQAGVPAKIVAERLGHSSTTITLNVYSHVSPAMASDAAEKVASLIFGNHG